MTSRLAIVEDHGLIAHTVASAFRSRDVEVTVVPPASADALVTTVVGLAPDLALVDLDLGDDVSALDLLPALAEHEVPAVVLTGVRDRVRHAQCVAAGARAVLTKDGSFDELAATVDRALAGEPLLSRHEREEHLALLRQHQRAEEARLAPFRELTPREAEVLAGLIRGRSVEQIATECVVAVSTVRSQVRAILRKLGVSSQLAAIARAKEAEWQPPSGS
ncbi:LuxR C-terminal-related transcriptional regulator [Egicoccus sp. AB-alg2]|uniref:LuxR C-terminal-related transcriptional regulator n=1 Tax=Egicoccus sp. AB-alg2 TaxID=3242693 RepID=UPI00359E406D